MELRLNSALELLQFEGKPIVAQVPAESLGCRIPGIADLLRASSNSHMPIWKKDQSISGYPEVNGGVPDIVSHLIREEVPVNARE